MNRTAILAIAVLLILAFAPLGSTLGPVQPPVDTTTLYVGTTSWGPRTADPAHAYDPASEELLLNVYDRLIAYGSDYANAMGTWHTDEEYYFFEPMLATNVPTGRFITGIAFYDTGINIYDPTCYWFQPIVNPPGHWFHVEGWVDDNANDVVDLADTLYIGEYTAQGIDVAESITVRTFYVAETGTRWTLYRFVYEFNIRTSPVVNFYDSTGAVVGTLGMDDFVYTFQRMLTKDEPGSPVWMYYKPMFDQMDSTGIVDHNAPTHNSAWLLAKLIGGAIEDAGGNVLNINLGISFTHTNFMQVLAQTWSSIMDKDWTVARSLFNGNLYEDLDADGIPDWIINSLKHPEPLGSVLTGNYAGSGPYRISVVSTLFPPLIVLSRNPDYWQGWPYITETNTQRKTYLEHINIEYLSNWNERKPAFIAGQLDVCEVPRSNQQEIMDSYGEPAYSNIKTIKNIAPSLSMDSMFYTFTVNPASESLHGGLFPSGIPADFLNNTYVRKAFSYAFDHAAFLTQAWMGEAIDRETPAIFGLYPDNYYKYAPDPPWTYDWNPAQMIANLQAAMFTQGDQTKSVWDWGGFQLDMFYSIGDEAGRIVCEMVHAHFASIGSFGINIRGVQRATFFNLMEDMSMPVWVTDWRVDYSDVTDPFAKLMHSYSQFAYFQNYTAANGWNTQVGTLSGMTGKDTMIDLAIRKGDGTTKQNLLYDLNDIYVNDNPSLPLAQPLERKWMQYFVKGWEYNTLLPSLDFYHLYKEDACWADVTSATIGVPDGRTDMRDIGYIAGHFGAKAPDTARTPPYDPKWAPGVYGMAGADVYGDRKCDMRDIGFAAAHFGHATQP